MHNLEEQTKTEDKKYGQGKDLAVNFSIQLKF